MMDTARSNNRLLEIGYQRNYNPVYQSAYNGVMKTGALGEIYHVAPVVGAQRQLAPQPGDPRRRITTPRSGATRRGSTW